eukprot:4349007-Amphidinium_carterae.2
MGAGHSDKRYVLVMAATMTIDGKQVVMPFNNPIRSKHLGTIATMIAEVVLWLRNSTHTGHLDGSRIVRMMSLRVMEVESLCMSDIIKAKLLELGITQTFSPPHQPQSNGLAERMMGLMKTTARRLILSASKATSAWMGHAGLR